MRKKAENSPYISCIVAAAGKGSRMGADVNKIFLEFGGMPVLAHTLLALERCDAIHEIVIVTSEEDMLGCKDIAAEFSINKVKTITLGGAMRQDSVRNALQEISPKTEIVLIHDGARPLLTEDVIQSVIRGVEEHKAAAAGVACKNTLKIADDEQFILSTPDRNHMYEIQTPQGFNRDLIILAHQKAVENHIQATDDCYLAEQLGIPVKIVPGDYRNIKITTPEDLALAELFWEIHQER
ncbi:MAG: 2-C-methyl-D-erythritol 4-phosphate cytidylyltransferase [Ruminococcaceae bacterium]|nr:2-C-methyl-D-erythritol 4-phosphate cytidylyltransferase [Oscillospiraceae bacterium]